MKTGLKLIYLTNDLLIYWVYIGFNMDLSIHEFRFALSGLQTCSSGYRQNNMLIQLVLKLSVKIT